MLEADSEDLNCDNANIVLKHQLARWLLQANGAIARTS